MPSDSTLLSRLRANVFAGALVSFGLFAGAHPALAQDEAAAEGEPPPTAELASAEATPEAPLPDTRGLDEEIQALKKDVVDLNKDLFVLEEELLSDGSLNADNQVDNTADGRGKFMWVSDNQSTASSIMLVYSPGGRPGLRTPDPMGATTGGKQIGYFRADASVETAAFPGANAVNLLVETVLLNYMALHGEEALFSDANHFPNHGLGSVTNRDRLMAFTPIVNGVIGG